MADDSKSIVCVIHFHQLHTLFMFLFLLNIVTCNCSYSFIAFHRKICLLSISYHLQFLTQHVLNITLNTINVRRECFINALILLSFSLMLYENLNYFQKQFTIASSNLINGTTADIKMSLICPSEIILRRIDGNVLPPIKSPCSITASD